MSASHTTNRPAPADRLIVFFDGRCPFCIRWVKLLIDRDGRDNLRFAALQSEWTQRYLEERGLPHPGTGSVLVWDGVHLHSESDAVARIGRALPGIWHCLKGLRLLPRRLRDGLYTFIGERRYKWFGQRETCWLPTGEERAKFLDCEDPLYQNPHK